MVVPALRTGVAQAGPAALFERDVVLEVRAARGPLAHRPGTRRVPDLGQVPQLDAGIMNPGGSGPGGAWPRGSGRAQACPRARPRLSVTDRHHDVVGFAALAAARSRASHGSTGPRPGSSPGRSASPSKVASGTVRWFRPANPAGNGPPPDPGAWYGPAG